jgi:hypothetical protein
MYEHSLFATMGPGYTYKDPIPNISMRLTLFRIPKLRVFSSEIGRTKMSKSSMMLKIAPEYPTTVRFTHVPVMVRSQIEEIGEHWKIRTRR